MPLEQLMTARSIQQATALVAGWIESGAIASEKYSWFTSIAAQSTETFIAEALELDPPIMFPKIGDLTGNLQAASAHLDQALARQEKLYELEAGATNAVIDDLLFDQRVSKDEKLALTNLRALLSQAGAHAENATGKDIDALFQATRDVAKLRRQLRDMKGSAFNLGERIEFLRTLQVDTIRSLFERLDAIRACMATSGIHQMRAVPAWDRESGLKALRALALWTREAIRFVERSYARERRITLTVSSLDPNLACFDTAGLRLSQEEIQKRLASAGFDQFKFELTPQFIATSLAISAPRSVRITGAALGLVFDSDLASVQSFVKDVPTDKELFASRRDLLTAWRESLRFGGNIVAPDQVALASDGTQHSRWSIKAVLHRDDLSITRVLGASAMDPELSEALFNINPIGQWVLALSSWARTPDRIAGLLNDAPFDTTKNPMAKVLGFNLTLKLAWR